jgi:hypothetical protein
MSGPEEPSGDQWDSLNYFNYFTEVEEHFQRARGTGLFLMSPLDWALIEGWKGAGIPLEAVLRGIDQAFEKWRARKQRGRRINSLAYCSQAVVEEAQALAGLTTPATSRQAEAPFSLDELKAHLARIASETRSAGHADVAGSLDAIAADAESHYGNLEELEQRLTSLEEKLLARIRASLADEELLAARQHTDSQLRAYRSKFTADQLARLERQLIDRWLFDRAKAPRYSLFYLK